MIATRTSRLEPGEWFRGVIPSAPAYRSPVKNDAASRRRGQAGRHTEYSTDYSIECVLLDRMRGSRSIDALISAAAGWSPSCTSSARYALLAQLNDSGLTRDCQHCVPHQTRFCPPELLSGAVYAFASRLRRRVPRQCQEKEETDG